MSIGVRKCQSTEQRQNGVLVISNRFWEWLRRIGSKRSVRILEDHPAFLMAAEEQDIQLSHTGFPTAQSKASLQIFVLGCFQNYAINASIAS